MAVEVMEVGLRVVAAGRLPIALVTFLLLMKPTCGRKVYWDLQFQKNSVRGHHGNRAWQAGMVLKHYLRVPILIHREEAGLSGDGVNI